MEEKFFGKWRGCTLPMEVVEADARIREEMARAPGRKLRLMPSATLEVPAAAVAKPDRSEDARKIFADCCQYA